MGRKRAQKAARDAGIMVAPDDALLFIDANKYLDLYRTLHGKKLLGSLTEQSNRILVTQQVVNEVQRNKISESAAFFARQSSALWKEADGNRSTEAPGLATARRAMPNSLALSVHLSGDEEELQQSIKGQMSDIKLGVDRVIEDVRALSVTILDQIYRSEDEVSKALAPIFALALSHSPDELQRARERRERGDPPGKSSGSIGDQLNWEQILTAFAGKKALWIISRDLDFGTFYEGRGYLNLFLYDELRRLNSHAEAFLFDDVSDGIKDFASKTGVKAERLPTQEDTQEIKKEEKQLPPVDWLDGNSHLVAMENAARRGWPRWNAGVMPQSLIVQAEFPPSFLYTQQPMINRPPPGPPAPPPRQTVAQTELPPEALEPKQPGIM